DSVYVGMVVHGNGIYIMEYIQDINNTETDTKDIYTSYDTEINLQPLPVENFMHYFYIIVFPYFLLFGTVGNCLSIVLMRRYSGSVWSTCGYMPFVCLIDLIKLYVECGNDWLKKLYNDEYNLSEQILDMSNSVCKVYSFVYHLIVQEKEWIMVAVAIETAIASKRPTLIYRMCSRERGNAIMLFISVMLISLNLHFFWTYGLVKPGDDPSINVYLYSNHVKGTVSHE
ncbi:hypothetical protein DPMN_113509, partial [Dreissena polymorpha]